MFQIKSIKKNGSLPLGPGPNPEPEAGTGRTSRCRRSTSQTARSRPTFSTGTDKIRSLCLRDRRKARCLVPGWLETRPESGLDWHGTFARQRLVAPLPRLKREIGNLLPNNRRQRRTCYALCHILYPVSAAQTSIFRMDSNSTSSTDMSGTCKPVSRMPNISA